MSDQTCKQRLPKEFRYTKRTFAKLFNPSRKWLYDNGLDPNNPDEAPTMYVVNDVLELGFTSNTHGVRVPADLRPVVAMLSTGGPADGFILGVDRHNNIRSAWYYFQDWFDGATRKLDAGSEFESNVIEVFQPFVDGLDYDQWLEDNE